MVPAFYRLSREAAEAASRKKDAQQSQLEAKIAKDLEAIGYRHYDDGLPIKDQRGSWNPNMVFGHPVMIEHRRQYEVMLSGCRITDLDSENRAQIEALKKTLANAIRELVA